MPTITTATADELAKAWDSVWPSKLTPDEAAETERVCSNISEERDSIGAIVKRADRLKQVATFLRDQAVTLRAEAVKLRKDATEIQNLDRIVCFAGSRAAVAGLAEEVEGLAAAVTFDRPSEAFGKRPAISLFEAAAEMIRTPSLAAIRIGGADDLSRRSDVAKLLREFNAIDRRPTPKADTEHALKIAASLLSRKALAKFESIRNETGASRLDIIDSLLCAADTSPIGLRKLFPDLFGKAVAKESDSDEDGISRDEADRRAAIARWKLLQAQVDAEKQSKLRKVTIELFGERFSFLADDAVADALIAKMTSAHQADNDLLEAERKLTEARKRSARAVGGIVVEGAKDDLTSTRVA